MLTTGEGETPLHLLATLCTPIMHNQGGNDDTAKAPASLIKSHLVVFSRLSCGMHIDTFVVVGNSWINHSPFSRRACL